MSPLLSVTVLLTAAVLLVTLARRFGLPTILAYLALGALLGPHGLAWVVEDQDVARLAEFGVVFLMFSIGLEFNLGRLKSMRYTVFGLGGAQLLLTAAATSAVTAAFYQQGWRSGLAVGLAVAMSSTAIVARMLSERFELHSHSGRQTMGVLLFQDLAVVPCLILLPALASPGEQMLMALLRALLVAVIVLGLLIWLGQRLMRRIYDVVAIRRSAELFMLTTLWLIVSLAWMTEYAGLSMALGAFVGGMLISETRYRHQVEADVAPFRDVLLGLFFVTVGMQLDMGFMVSNLHHLLLAVLLLVGGKALVVLAITLAVRTPLDVALRTTAQLAQAGEFGLVLIALAYSSRLIAVDTFQLTLSAMLLSMFLAPGVIAQMARLGQRLGRGDWAHRAQVVHAVAVRSMDLSGHVILCGYGRTGSRVAEFLAAEQISCLALDVDPRRVPQVTTPAAPTAAGQDAAIGPRVVFGSADRFEVLQAAGLARARAVVVTYPDTSSAMRVLQHVRSLRPDLPVIVRAADESDVERLKAAGAAEVIPDVLEGSLMIAAETLTRLGVPVDQAIGRVRRLRAERYATLREFYRAGERP
jgi:CPA2 family monovalent cation:H+ antiporter-2